MSDVTTATIPLNLPALVTRSIMLQNAKTALDAATAKEQSLNDQIMALHNQQMLATQAKQTALNNVSAYAVIPDTELDTTLYRQVSLIEQAALPERQMVKGACFDYLVANPTADFATVCAFADTTAGPTRMHNYTGVFTAYMANALSLKMVPDDTWASFTAFLLAIGKATMLTL